LKASWLNPRRASSTRIVLTWREKTRPCRSDGEDGDNAVRARDGAEFAADRLWITFPHLPTYRLCPISQGCANPRTARFAPRSLPAASPVGRRLGGGCPQPFPQSPAVIHNACPLIHILLALCDQPAPIVTATHASFRPGAGCANQGQGGDRLARRVDNRWTTRAPPRAQLTEAQSTARSWRDNRGTGAFWYTTKWT
jgi:hypothetical protein